MTDTRPWLLSRRALFAVSLACPAAAVTGQSAPGLFEDVVRYAGHGDQQTGSPGGRRTEAWVAGRLRDLGFQVQLDPVTYRALDTLSARLALAAGEIAATTQQPGAIPPGGALTAQLAMADRASDLAAARGRIGVVNLPFGRHSSILDARIRAVVDPALEAGLAGLVLVTHGPSGLVTALNAPLDHPLSALPTVLVAPRVAGPLLNAAQAGAIARLEIAGRPIGVQGHNIVARRQGRGSAIVVTTPLSGWFACAGERGSGVAAFLALAGTLARTMPDATLLFAGLVGHERENVGGHRFVRLHAPPPDEVRLWVHIGANFAARDWHEAGGVLLPLPSADSQRYLLVPEPVLPLFREGLRDSPGFASPYPAVAANAAGEARHILEAGYGRLVANFGAHRLHHTPLDTPDAVDPASLETSWHAWSTAVLATLAGSARD